MLLIAVGLILAGIFVLLSERARRGSERARVWAALEAGLLIAPALFALYAGALYSGFRCDEACGVASTDPWWRQVDAWQWSALFAFAALGCACVIAALVLTIRRRPLIAAVTMLTGTAAFAAWAAFMAPLGNAVGL